MDSIKKITKKDLLYNNLLLLGLKPEETIKTSKIEITKDCLDKYLFFFNIDKLTIFKGEPEGCLFNPLLSTPANDNRRRADDYKTKLSSKELE